MTTFSALTFSTCVRCSVISLLWGDRYVALGADIADYGGLNVPCRLGLNRGSASAAAFGALINATPSIPAATTTASATAAGDLASFEEKVDEGAHWIHALNLEA